jgi:hypothetical protein
VTTSGRALDLSVIRKTTVSGLRSEVVHRGPDGSRGEGVESTFNEVRARLISARAPTLNQVSLSLVVVLRAAAGYC